jgi:hypothetical protein
MLLLPLGTTDMLFHILILKSHAELAVRQFYPAFEQTRWSENGVHPEWNPHWGALLWISAISTWAEWLAD